jgi:predicted MFS family arabinose efflux permease
MSPTRAFSLPGSQGRWWILGLLFACRTGLGFQFQSLGSVSGSIRAELGFSHAEIGTLIGLFMLPGLLLAMPAGYLGRCLSDRVLVGMAFLSLAAGGFIAALAQGFGMLALGRLAAGAGFVVSTIYLTKMTADWFAGKDLATAMGILVMSWPFGIAMSQVGHVWIDLEFGWRSAFGVAAAYCALGAVAMLLLYRPPQNLKPLPAGGPVGLPRNELMLTLLAATVWGLFNAGYVVYLSFAPRVLVDAGSGEAQAAAIVSIGSWVMIFSGAAWGRIADRSGRHDLIMYVCTAIGVVTLLLWQYTGLAPWLSLLVGLFGVAPAGIIMALTGQAMAPQRRAFGMGVFFTLYFVILTLAPPLAGWLYDHTSDAFSPMLFSAALFGAAALVYRAFRVLKNRSAAA